MAVFQSVIGTLSASEISFNIELDGPAIYSGTEDPTVTPPTPVADGLRDGDIYIRTLSGSEGIWLFSNETFIEVAGDISIGGLNYPTIDGTAGQVLTTDGSGNLTFEDASGGDYFGLTAEDIADISVTTWNARTVAEANFWQSITWSPELGLFAAVAQTGTSRVMTSPDGITWTARTAEANFWDAIAWSSELGLFAAVAVSGTNLVMTSSDGITWTSRTAAEANAWESVTWSPELGLFVAVAFNGTNRVMTSPDGITWTARTAVDNFWKSVTWSPELGLFAAVSGTFGANPVMTSPDGITWTAREAPDNVWQSITWSPEIGLFAAVSINGTNRVMTSPDGITWTGRTAPEANPWSSIAWSPELGIFAAVSQDGTNRVMTSTFYDLQNQYLNTNDIGFVQEVKGDVAFTGSISINGVDLSDQGMELVEYADLTNGGANDLATFELTHDMVDGYRYHLYVKNLSSTSEGWVPVVRMRNVAGTLRATNGDYRQSLGYVGGYGVSNESRGGIVPYTNGQTIPRLVTFDMCFDDPMNPAVKTTGRMDVSLSDNAISVRTFGSFNVDVAEAHDSIIIGVAAGTMDSGEAFLWRIKEPS